MSTQTIPESIPRPRLDALHRDLDRWNPLAGREIHHSQGGKGTPNPACAGTVTKGESPFVLGPAQAGFATGRDPPLEVHIRVWVGIKSPYSPDLMSLLVDSLFAYLFLNLCSPD